MAAEEAANMTSTTEEQREDLEWLQSLTRARTLRPFSAIVENQLKGTTRWPGWWTLAALATAGVALTMLVIFVTFDYCRFRHYRGETRAEKGGDPSE